MREQFALFDPFFPRFQEYQQQQPRIGIVIGSTREGRFGEKPAHWIHEIAKQRTDLTFDLIDLRDHPLPFFNVPRSPAYGPVMPREAASTSHPHMREDWIVRARSILGGLHH